MIQRWGGIGYLVRDSVQRAATMAYMEYTPRERGLYADKSARIRVSVIGLVVPPHHEQDTVLYEGETYNVLLPIEGPRMGIEFVYYDLNVMRVSGPAVAS